MSGTTDEHLVRSRARARPPAGRQRRRSRSPLPAVLALVVLAVGAAAVLLLLQGQREETATREPDAAAEPERAPVIADPAPGEWRLLPAPPVGPRTEQEVAWSGSELLVWGGSLEDGFGQRIFHSDGAALAPSGAWRVLPPSPLEPRAGHVAVWTGTELAVWGGTGRTRLHDDGALLDPVSGVWRALPQSPLSPRSDAVGVWTGREVLILAGSDLGGPLADGAAYDPQQGVWRTLPPLPEEFSGALEMRGIAEGDGALVWTADQGGLAFTHVARYRTGSDSWEEVPVPVGEDAGLPVLTAGGGALYGLRVSFDGTRADLLTLGPGETGWAEVPAPTSFGDPWRATGVWTGSSFVVASGDPSGGSVVYDPQAGTWMEIPPAPVPGTGEHSVVWSGTELLVWGGSGAADAEAAGSAAWHVPPPG